MKSKWDWKESNHKHLSFGIVSLELIPVPVFGTRPVPGTSFPVPFITQHISDNLQSSSNQFSITIIHKIVKKDSFKKRRPA